MHFLSSNFSKSSHDDDHTTVNVMNADVILGTRGSVASSLAATHYQYYIGYIAYCDILDSLTFLIYVDHKLYQYIL
jgi:hypothetical protein